MLNHSAIVKRFSFHVNESPSDPWLCLLHFNLKTLHKKNPH